ncbi:MAG: circadian clock protein KaiC [Acidobacteria bacterium]|nr:circadian clock protein KaiC [Acidobacteriota bacterium]
MGDTIQASTGISGLDELMGGGFPTRRMHLIEGVPGTGKTTLALQFLLAARDRGERTLYVTLSETTEELASVAESHGWSLDGIETHQLAPVPNRAAEEYTLYHPAEVELGDLTKTVLDRADRVKPSCVVLDSLSELRLLARDPLRYRRQVLGLKEFFAARGATVLVLDDHSTGENDLQLRSIAHGVVLLQHLPFDYGRARRQVRIVKMRGMAVTEGFHDFVIRRGGLVVFPQLVARASARPAPSGPIRSGVDELDTLIGGGLTWGTTTLFIGPAGVGKSTVAAQYLCGAANPGCKAAVFLFDERLKTFVDRCDALGMRASERIATGHLIPQQIDPGVTSPGEFAHRVKRLVDEEGVRLIGIDTLNGYVNAIPTTDAPIIRMHELLSFLNERGVATLIVLAQHGTIGAVMPTPVDLSYLADAIVLFRFFEEHGHICRALSVVKKRTGNHETAIRELRIGPTRVEVGQPLTEFRGVLTGVPQYNGSSKPDDRSH